MRLKLFVAGIKYVANETIELLAVVDAEVVGAGFEINMRAQEIAAAVQAEDGRGGGDEREAARGRR